MSADNNYLLNIQGLPEFSKIRAQYVAEAVNALISSCRHCIEETLDQVEKTGCYTYEALVEPIARAEDRLDLAWSPVSHLNSVMNTDELRTAHDGCLPAMSDYATYVGQNRRLYEAYMKMMRDPSFQSLSAAKKKDVENTMRDFRLSGIALSPEDQETYRGIVSRLSELGSTFSNNVLDAVNSWYCQVTDKAELSGLPDSALALARANAEARELDGWVFTLDFPSYLPVMQYADSAALRKKCYEAYVTRASDRGPDAGKWNNEPVLKEILALRHRLALLLGFKNYAEYSLAEKMAETPKQVMDFLNDLASRCRRQGERDDRQLRDFARDSCGCAELNAWDRAYYSEKLKQSRFSFSSEELRPYFPLSRVLSGLFETCRRLYGITVKKREDGVDLYHSDVSFYDVFGADGELRGGFYLDPYARKSKRAGAWMDDCIDLMRLSDGSVRHPVAFVVCNFNPPVGGQESLLTHDDVTTIFHEFGHALNHILTKVEVAGVTGISGVPWDAVELPSQFMENWCWESEALKFISGHVATGEPLPDDKLKLLLDSKNFQSALFVLRQLMFGLTDFRLHLEYDGDNKDLVRNVIDSVRGEVCVDQVPEYNRFEDSFTHVFSGGYAAGYYSYLWAELLSSDAFSRFEEEGIFSRRAGEDFMRCILEAGGSVPSMDQFRAFRGREPKIDALLRHRGISG